ncbi:hypothetical protein [Tsukamurella serpentis]
MRGIDDLLADAFGAGAGAAGPVDSGGGRRWLRAVALAGTGRFAAARTLAATVADGPFASPARCLEASMLRQSGRHCAASGPDGAALALALATDGDPAPTGDSVSPLTVAARTDAAVGLAADALGTGRFALSARLLRRAERFLDEFAAAPPPAGPAAFDPTGPAPAWWTVPRARLRLDWVAAELAVYSGDADGAAAAVDLLLAADPGPAKPRHHAKTLLIAGAAALASDDGKRAEELVIRAYDLASTTGFHPLQWAGAKMLNAVSTDGRGDVFLRDAAVVEAKWIRDGAELARL